MGRTVEARAVHQRAGHPKKEKGRGVWRPFSLDCARVQERNGGAKCPWGNAVQAPIDPYPARALFQSRFVARLNGFIGLDRGEEARDCGLDATPPLRRLAIDCLDLELLPLTQMAAMADSGCEQLPRLLRAFGLDAPFFGPRHQNRRVVGFDFGLGL